MNHKDITITFKVRGGSGQYGKDVLILANDFCVGFLNKSLINQNKGWAIDMHNFGLYFKDDFGGNLARGKKALIELFKNGANSENACTHKGEETMLRMVCEFVECQQNKKNQEHDR